MGISKFGEMSPDAFEEYVLSTFPPPDFAAGDVADWVDGMIMKGTSYLTVYQYTQTARDFLEFTNKPPKAITDMDVKAYAKYLLNKGKSRSTVLSYLVRVGVFLKAMGNPVNVYKYTPKLDVVVPEYLTEREVSAFIAAIDEDILSGADKNTELAVMRYKTLFTLLADTGLRISEACNLAKSNVDFSERLITVEKGKRNKYRQVPTSKSTLDMIKAYWDMRTDNLPYVFEYNGKKLDRMTVWHVTKRIAKKAGLNVRTRTHGEQIYPHIFRHTFATNELKRLIKEGNGRMDALLIIQKALGHSDIKTTMIYLTLLGEDIRDMMGR